MPLVLLLWCLQEPPADEKKPPQHSDVEFGAIRQYWWPRFRGSLNEDHPGTLRLVDDLRLPNDATIPMTGGGDIWVSVRQSLSQNTVLLFSAEYWTHGWSGYNVLESDEALDGRVFPAGTGTESRFHLMSLTLDMVIVHEEKPFSAGLYLPLQVLSSRLRMDAPGRSEKVTLEDVCLGTGGFAEVRPFSWCFIGASARGLTGVGEVGRTIVGDFRGYGGIQAGPVTLEGGYRYELIQLADEDRELDVSLYGAYASLTLTLKF